MQSHEIHLELVKLDLTNILAWPTKGWKISARGQVCVRARTQPVPHGPAHRHPRGGKDSKVLLRARLLVTTSEKLDCRFKLGGQWVTGWERQETANQGRKDQFCGSMGSSGLNVHPVTGCGDGCLVFWHCALPRSPTLHLWPLLCNSILQSALLLPEKRPQFQDGWSNRGWFRGRKVRHC